MKIQLREFDVLKSTNETAVAMAQEGAPEGTVIVAARQEGGHGRMQRVWVRRLAAYGLPLSFDRKSIPNMLLKLPCLLV